MYAELHACKAPVREPWGRYVCKRRVLRLGELQDAFPGAVEMPVVPIRPGRPRQSHPFGLPHALMGRRDGKQRP